MRQDKMGHPGWLMQCKQLQCRIIGQMTLNASYTFFKIVRISACCQHLLIIVCFEKSCIALFKVLGHVFTGYAYICKYSHLNHIALYDKAMGIVCIMKFGKRSYGK